MSERSPAGATTESQVGPPPGDTGTMRRTLTKAQGEGAMTRKRMTMTDGILLPAAGESEAAVAGEAHLQTIIEGAGTMTVTATAKAKVAVAATGTMTAIVRIVEGTGAAGEMATSRQSRFESIEKRITTIATCSFYIQSVNMVVEVQVAGRKAGYGDEASCRVAGGTVADHKQTEAVDMHSVTEAGGVMDTAVETEQHNHSKRVAPHRSCQATAAQHMDLQEPVLAVAGVMWLA